MEFWEQKYTNGVLTNIACVRFLSDELRNDTQESDLEAAGMIGFKIERVGKRATDWTTTTTQSVNFNCYKNQECKINSICGVKTGRR